ncbi:MAG: MarR family winged helix-turn-helix transcriptional regulator [Dermatophilaceae bacterium]
MPNLSKTIQTAQLDALMRASRAFSGIVAASLAQVGDQVTAQQLRALVIVATHDQAKAGAVSDALDIHPSSATRLCDKLVLAGLLDRQTDPGDRRQVTLRLTPAGSRLLAAVMDHRRRALARVLSALTPDDRVQLQRCLTLFSDALSEPDENDWHLHDVQVGLAV